MPRSPKSHSVHVDVRAGFVAPPFLKASGRGILGYGGKVNWRWRCSDRPSGRVTTARPTGRTDAPNGSGLIPSIAPFVSRTVIERIGSIRCFARPRGGRQQLQMRRIIYIEVVGHRRGEAAKLPMGVTFLVF